MLTRRLALLYLTDVVRIARRDSSLLDVMVFSLVASASVAPVRQDPGLDRAYAALDNPPPDGLRRPIAINAVAGSLGLPFESVRRAAGRLADLGEIEITRGGLVQSEARVDAPEQVAVSLALYDRTRELYGALQAARPAAMGGPAQVAGLTEPPVRLVHRLVGIYALRVMTRVVAWIGQPSRTLVYMEALRSAYAPDPGGEGAVQPAEVGLRSGLPRETVRRQLNSLVEAGLLAREGRVLRIGPESWGLAARAEDEAAAIDFRRLMAQLDRYGVCAWWDAERDVRPALRLYAGR